MRIAIIGEFRNSIPQRTLNQSLEYLSNELDFKIEYKWIETTKLEENPQDELSSYHGIWSAPGGPFKSLQGAVNAIQYARENNVPHLGTCSGFQLTVIEIARNMLGYKEAQHEEYDPESSQLFVSRLTCSLAEKTMRIQIKEGSQAFKWYGGKEAEENYYCNFGINPDFRAELNHPDVVFSGVDHDGEIRIIEINKNDFFISTLFVPQTKSAKGNPQPLIEGFIREAFRQCSDREG